MGIRVMPPLQNILSTGFNSEQMAYSIVIVCFENKMQ